jgi:hypothetical protein
MNMAFHQVELDDSRDITTFSGPDALYRYKRLIFGVNMATEKFQSIISQVLKGCAGVHNMHDDIRIVAENYQQLYERVELVIRKFQENGLTLNFPKCEVGDSMVLMGHKMSAQGVQISESKIEAVTKAPRPTQSLNCGVFLV